MAEGMRFNIMSQLWYHFKTRGMNWRDAALTQTPRRADCLVCLISISSLTDSQNLDVILSPRIWKTNNQSGAISSALADLIYEIKNGTKQLLSGCVTTERETFLLRHKKT